MNRIEKQRVFGVKTTDGTSVSRIDANFRKSLPTILFCMPADVNSDISHVHLTYLPLNHNLCSFVNYTSVSAHNRGVSVNTAFKLPSIPCPSPTMSVKMLPGWTQKVVRPCSAYSAAIKSVKRMTAVLDV